MEHLILFPPMSQAESRQMSQKGAQHGSIFKDSDDCCSDAILRAFSKALESMITSNQQINDSITNHTKSIAKLRVELVGNRANYAFEIKELYATLNYAHSTLKDLKTNLADLEPESGDGRWLWT